MSKENQNINISITFRHTEPTSALKEYATEKITHCLEKYLSYEADVQIVLSVEKRDHMVEVKVHSKNYNVTSKGVTDDLYSAIDKVVDNIVRQLRKQKEIHVNHKRQPAIS